jgi:hypothetical protein
MNCGDHVSPESQPKIPTTDDIVAAVLQHMSRYRLTVLEALQRLSVFASVGSRRIRRLLNDCQEQQLIGAAALHHGLTYWHLQADGSRRLEPADQQHGPLSEPAKIRAYALLRFCCLSDHPRQRLTRQEIASRLPELHRHGMAGTYYFAPEGPGRLGMARIDAGHHGRWDRIIQTLREDIDAHLRRPAWRRLIEAQRFELAVLTVFPQKAERLREALAKLPHTQCIPVQLVALPELLPLVRSVCGKEVSGI